MTYYEEFGITKTATEEEIRLAHRRLIKLLHPDLQQDQALRKLAGTQSCRLNLIAETLLDSNKRIQYNRSLSEPPIRPGIFRLPLVSTAVATSIAIVLALAWTNATNNTWAEPIPRPPEPMSPHSPSIKTPDVHAPVPVRTPVTIAATALPTKDTHEPILQQPDPHPEPITLNPQDNTPQLPLPVPHSQSNKGPETQEKEDGLVGTWVYIEPAHFDDDRNMYRPEYIEMRIREIGGQIVGDYTARYRITDRPLTPNVTFHFEGPIPSGTSTVQANLPPAAVFQWKTTKGLHGILKLTFKNTDSVQTDWNVIQGATAADLVAGNATLTRAKSKGTTLR